MTYTHEMAKSQIFDADSKKITEIIDFLTCDKWSKDLWAHPFLKVDADKILPMIAPFKDSVLIRCVEIWLSQSKLEISKKGYNFEKTIREELELALASNDVLLDYETTKLQKFSFGGEREEIDLILRVGSLILLGEAKCIVSTDSSISYKRTLDRIKEASSQAKRKAAFIKKNLNEFFSRVGWNCDATDDYNIQPIVINSNQMGVGFSLFGVPTTDLRLLKSYFSKKYVPLYSVPDGDTLKHIVKVILYKKQREAETGLLKYLNNPPQLRHIISNIDYHYVPILGHPEDKVQWGFLRLITNNPKSYRDIVNDDDLFEIEIDENFDIETLNDIPTFH